ncbi:transposase [Defluviimonas sp. SAOS-178_SWC]|uniref:transposase n=1 Tax=Defluviimonas sp. SAOS-178_SWC TaxID=3121287 RepID=UPI003D80AAF4
MREECRDLLQQIEDKTVRVDARTQKAHRISEDAETAKRLRTLPGVCPITVLAFEAFAPDMRTFRRGRDYAAWLGLVPRQHSSGGKERWARVTKAGQADIRRLLIIGAMSQLNRLGRLCIAQGSWLERMLARNRPNRDDVDSSGVPFARTLETSASLTGRQLWGQHVRGRSPATIAAAPDERTRVLSEELELLGW